MCLMHAMADASHRSCRCSSAQLATARQRYMPEVHVASIDHGLRPESSSEAAYVELYARALGFGATSEKLRLRESKHGKLMPEARAARYRALAATAEQLEATAVLMAHHRGALLRISSTAGRFSL